MSLHELELMQVSVVAAATGWNVVVPVMNETSEHPADLVDRIPVIAWQISIVRFRNEPEECFPKVTPVTATGPVLFTDYALEKIGAPTLFAGTEAFASLEDYLQHVMRQEAVRR